MRLEIALCLVAVALARPQDERSAKINVYEHEQTEDGSWETFVDTSNDITIEDTGIVTAGSEPETGTLTKTGSFEFAHPNGEFTLIGYVADENGFRPEGDAIPVFTGRVDIRNA